MMDLDSAIQHAEEVVEKHTKYNRYGGFESCDKCAEEHRQLAEWLKELKEYKEQRGERMNVEEKERLIKKDIESIENRVRHAFNQGYEMGRKESRSEKPNTCSDAISRKYILDLIDTKGANLDDDLLIVAQWIQDAPSVNPHPIECGDAISRQAVLDIITFEDKWLFDANGHNANTRIALSGLESRVKALPSVTPQPRTGRWIEHFDEIGKWYECDQCHTDWGGSVNYCPNCGCKMEVKE